LEELLGSDPDGPALFHSVLHQLSFAPGTTLVVFEDAHWADQATLDLLRFLSNGIFVVSWSAIAAFLVASGFAALSTRALPQWLGWAALVIGIGMFLAGAAPLSPIWFFPYFLFLVWVLATSVVLIIGKPISSPRS
jgi:hypothetical protein